MGRCLWLKADVVEKRDLYLDQYHCGHNGGGSNSSGFILILHNFATHPLSCTKVWTPSRMRMCVNPISLMNSNFECSERVGMVLVTRNIVLMMSCDEYPRSLDVKRIQNQC